MLLPPESLWAWWSPVGRVTVVTVGTPEATVRAHSNNQHPISPTSLGRSSGLGALDWVGPLSVSAVESVCRSNPSVCSAIPC